MTDYIIPQIIKYQNINDLLKNNNRGRSLFDTGSNLSIDELLQENFVCVVGEPGIGKSRLVEEIGIHTSEKTLFICKASELKDNTIPENIEYCIIDALDEVDGNSFYNTLLLIKQYNEGNPNVKVLFTCRKHYVESYSIHFSSCKRLIYVELCRLRDDDVMRIVNKCPEATRENVIKSEGLKKLLTIPRYLTFFLEYDEERGDCKNIGELFEYIVGRSIQGAVEACSKENKNESFKILIQRVLEKIAFIMEISRKDQISKDDLYTILDGVKGNMTQMLVANFDLLFFESRILKDTNGTLQFENTELQEYLASKELCRQDNIESVIYDVAVQKDLKHIYPNWYDVIPHLSYKEDNAHTFINVIKLIVSYESNFENESFESLLRYVDPHVLSVQEKEDLFSLIFEHYLRVPAYIGWNNQRLKLMQECYCPKCNVRLKVPAEDLNKIQLANICDILEVIVEKNKPDKDVSDYWTNVANNLIKNDSEENKLSALNLYKALNDTEILTRLAKSYKSFPQKVREKFCEITGYGKFTSEAVLDCWLNSCYDGNPYAINAILYIEDPSIMAYVYKGIIKAGKLCNFFNPKGTLLVCYELYLKKQFEILWHEDSEGKKIISKIIAAFVQQELYTRDNDINAIVKQILLEEKTGLGFIKSLDNVWRIEMILTRFDKELIDAELVTTIDRLLHNAETEDWCIDIILTNLINKIRNDEDKKDSVSEYISRYAETFERWDKNSEEEKERKSDNSSDVKAYEILTDQNVSKGAQYNAAFKLSNNIKYIQQQDPQPLVKVIEAFLDEIDLNLLKVQKQEDGSFSISTMLVMLPYFVRALYDLNFHDLLKKHRIVLTKTLPIVCFSTNFDIRTIKHIYKFVIGSLCEQEKAELISWWKSRKDDFLNVSSDSVFVCISEYGIDALTYKLDEYIRDYINMQQDLSQKFTATKALDLISKGYLKWDIGQYRSLFNALNDDDIESVKMQCNEIMIEQYQDEDAITWRIEYLKHNIVKSHYNDTEYVRVISTAESEMTSPNPSMFKCLMHIKGNEGLYHQMLDLFDAGLSLCDKYDTQEYASYLLKQIYFFFVNTHDVHYIYELRKKVERFSSTKVSYLANNIMNYFEIMYLQKEKNSIDKSIKLYNKCIEESHLEIRNEGDLRRFFTHIQSQVQEEIQDQGIYSLIRGSLSEDFIQRELKNTIINKCCQTGLEAVQVDREVALQDNKRTDLLIRYGFCNPIMVELKLLHNIEIQNEKKRREYKKKFIKYTNATNACLSVFWVFNVHNDGSDTTKFKNLEEEYKDLDNTIVILTDCKCSSGIDTGVSVNKQSLKLNKRGGIKKRK